MKELKLKEEVESALGLAERFYIIFFRHSAQNAHSNALKSVLEAIEKKRDDPRLFFFLIDVDKHPEVSIHLAGLTKVTPEIPQCSAYFNFRPMFTLSHQEITEEKLESLIPDFKK